VSIAGFLRARAMRAQFEDLTRQVEALQSQVGALYTRVAVAERTGATTAGADDLASAQAAPSPTPAPPQRARPVSTAPPPRVAPEPMPTSPRAVTPPPLPPPLPPPVEPAAVSPEDAAGPEGPSRGPTFDWESMLGVRGAAWLGGITLVIAALFFAKWSIDQGFFSPVIRLASMLLIGTGALAWAEVKLRAEYQTTANAVSGAGIVILYVAFFAGHSLYQLITLPVAFAGMSVVTLLAGVIAIRFAAQFTALIGLAGGLATPVLLSSGVDRPLASFSYLAVLAAGFLHVAERRAWASVTSVALVGTSMLELGWYANWIAPEKIPIGVAAFTVLGAIFLRHAVQTRQAEVPLMHQAALTGALVPLGFAMMLAAEARFADQWAVVTAFLVVVDLGLVGTALAWSLPVLVGASAVASGIVVLLLGDVLRGVQSAPWGLPLAMIALALGYDLVPRIASQRGAEWLTPPSRLSLLTWAATVGGLIGFTWLATSGGHLPLWAFVALLVTAFGIAVHRTQAGPRTGVFVAATFPLAWTSRHWVSTVATADSYADHLTLPHLLATAVAIVAGWRGLRPREAEDVEWWRTDHAATLVAAGVAYLTALDGLLVGAGRTPAPLFALVGLDVVLMLAVTVQTGWAWLVPVAAVMSLVFDGAWHGRYFNETRAAAGIAAYTATYLLFLAWPFAAARWLSPSWKTRPAPWLASALVGPAIFLLYYDVWRTLLGSALVGVVPVVMATVSVAALYGISRNFAPSAEPSEEQRRLNYLALFAAITLGFIATAVPLQLERQWITIGWALEAAAVWWLFGMLPHPGLKYFGFGLFLAVGVRLLANPEVLRYQPRGGPILNWLLYTYGVPALCCLAGTHLLREAERRRGALPEYDVLARDRDAPGPVVGFLGLLLVFWLINLEIADYYSVGRYVELDLSRHLARDLTRSCAWGLYALALLGAGLWRASRGLRLVSLGFLLLTVAKVFLYDLGQLTGLYRIMSFLALGVSLIVVSLLYQRFVRRSEVPA
jgi:uncharacterized membrane protein